MLDNVPDILFNKGGLFLLFIFAYNFLLTKWGIIVILLALYLAYEYRKWKDLPPGPRGLPIIGTVYAVEDCTMGARNGDMCRKYNTDILAYFSFGNPFVVLNKFEFVKELFQERSDVVDRNPYLYLSVFDPNFKGILNTNGQIWKESRRFVLQNRFGMGREKIAEQIKNEFQVLCEEFKTYEGKPFDPKHHINVAASNILCSMMFGKRYDHDNKEFQEALDAANHVFGDLNNLAMYFGFDYAIGRNLIYRKEYQEALSYFNLFNDFVVKRIEEHERSYTGDVTDLLHGFMKEMKEGRGPEVFNKHQLKALLMDYFLAGNESTYSTMRWAILAMALYPEIQTKVQEELDNTTESSIRFQDRTNTPYTEATICEIHRFYTVVQVGIPHTNLSRDIEFKGYRLPKGALIMSNVHEIHRSKEQYKNPDNFDPGNFLENGKLANMEQLMPYGIGRRSCPVEAMAKMEIYLFFTTIVKNFRILLPKGVDGPKMAKPNIFGLHKPAPFEITMEPR